MDQEILLESCRACLEVPGSISLFSKDDSLAYYEMLLACTSVTVLPGRSGPQNLCNGCTYRLRDAYSFRNQCQLSEAKLRDFHEFKQEEITDSVEAPEHSNFQLPEDDFCSDDDDKYSDLLPLQYLKTEEMCNSNNQDSNFKNLNEFRSAKDEKTKKEHSSDKPKKIKTFKKTIEDIYYTEVEITVKKPPRKNKTPKVAKFFCDVCAYAAFDRYHLTNHMRRHTGEKPFKCETCDNRYASKMSLRVHAKKCLDASICDICGKLFKNLEKHRLRTHGDLKPHHCNICAAAFCTREQLKQHNKCHEKEARVRDKICNICQKSFFEAKSLRGHMKTHTTDRELSTCRICHKTYIGKGLVTHMRLHTIKVKKFLCDYCQKAFRFKAELRSHIKTHLGIKAFECDECDKSFIYKCSLTSHKISHAKTKNYVCDICNQRFSYAGSLCEHKKKKHNIKSNRIVDALDPITSY